VVHGAAGLQQFPVGADIGERERLAMSEAMRPRQDYVNWDRVMERERIRLLVAQAEAAWWRNGGWGDLESAPMPRKHACSMSLVLRLLQHHAI
jgi:hypothetical protein